ncbi:fatty acyl-CoA reductase 1-like [Dermacentor variabilis]|uniref:fatty acyl-CoA reductase 1-like n=1 Tax=Dermacentor variabilis TaxID=34621 RepID=UPI003F5BE79F
MTNKARLHKIPSPAAEPKHNEESEIARFYEDRAIFITGGTGFIGKVLLEKLLRSCPVKRIYLLMRSKRGVEPEERLDELFKCEVFQLLKREVPDARSKVKVVAGDLALPGLGLSEADMTTICEEASVVFHLAATVRFFDSLKQLLQLNVIGTRCILDICKKMPNLCAFVHVSTAYSSWNRRDVQEMVYPAPIDAQKLIEVTEPTQLKVYNCTSSAVNPLTWGELLVDRYLKAVNGMDATSFYTTNSWLFRSDNVVGLINDLPPTDEQTGGLQTTVCGGLSTGSQPVLIHPRTAGP